MKQILCIFTAVLLFTSCDGQKSKAMKDQQKAYDKLEEISPDNVRTAEGSWTMTARMNGKPWNATSMFPALNASGRIIGYYKKESISLPYSKKKMEMGHKETFSDHNAVDIFTDDEVAIWGGREGEMVITKTGNGWAEGTFHVTAHEGNKTLAITDGFFRIKFAN